MKRLFALILALVVSTVNADTTANVLSGTNWTGVTNGTLPANRMPGSALLYDTATGTVHWSYSQATAAKTIAINNALSGSGIQVGGYNYTYDLRNMNGDDRQGSVDTMTVVTKMTSNTGATLLTNTNTHNTKFDWTTFNGTQSLNTALPLSGLGNLSISFNSKDSGFWAGYFGPEVRNVSMSLNYTADPCVTNPAYSTSCANYSTVVTSGNLFSGTTGAQAYAINTALANAGAGTMIHGFDYGYRYSVAGRDCAVWNLFGICISGWNYSDAGVTTTLTNSAGVVGYTESNTHNGGDNGVSGTYSKALRLGSSVPMSTLGTFSMTPWTSGTASITDMYSRAVYTPDPCTANPLSSTSCAGYQQAYHDQQCSINPLYAVDCVGYQQAYLTQQCSANALYNSACPGYSTAYYNNQCSLNALYDTGCPGYTTAYHNQQCSINALYATDCTDYDRAYLTQQCNANPLYSNRCTGYAQAYHDQQCSASALYASDCPGYGQAYHNQQCSANALYAVDCVGYQQAYLTQQCNANSLYSSQCPGYAVAYKSQQCSANALYATDCPGYAIAYHTQQCSLNTLYMSDCPGYTVAYKSQQCSISALYATDCPGYGAAYLNQQCNISQLYSTSCPNYAVAYHDQQCSLNGLYNRDCPNYSTAYAKTQLLAQQSPSTTTTPLSTQSDAAVSKATNALSTGISDPVISKAVASSDTTSQSSPTSITGANSAINPPAPAPTVQGAINSISITVPPTVAQQQERQSDQKKTDGAVSSLERKSGSDKQAAGKAAVAKAKENLEKAANAKTIEDQVAAQGLVVGLMGYVPGFSAYQNAIVPDTLGNAVARQYMKPNVDNRNAQRRLSGSQESRWQDMVDSQYKIGETK